MREIKIRVPKGNAEMVARLALSSGIEQVASHEVYVFGSETKNDELKIKSSTPKVKKFLSALFRAPFFEQGKFHFSSHDVRALVSGQPISKVTEPVYIPFSDIQQDLWMYSHVTLSFLIRVAASAGLLSYAMIKDDTVLAIGAMVFTPFSPLILSVAFGLVSRSWSLVRQALKALSVALLLTVGSSAIVAKVVGGPLLFNRFGSVSTNLIISLVAGFMAAVAEADEVGRRQLLGLAMAYPFVKFPTWIGIALAQGFPDAASSHERFVALFGNIGLMIVTAAVTFWVMGRRGELKHLPG